MLKNFSPLAQFDVVSLFPIFLGNYELSLSNLSCTVIFILIINYIIWYKFYLGRLIPGVFQNFLEFIFMFIFRTVYQQTGKLGLIYFPFIFSLFIFILSLNLLSMIPFGFAVTSHLIWTLYFSLSICLGIFFLGILRHKINFFKLFVPEVPFVLYPMMILIEIFSYIIRSFSLAIRLSANIMAGHTLVHIIASSISMLSNIKQIIVIFPFILLLAIFVLELGVACLQAYIFITLVSMYLNDSLHLSNH